MRKMRPTVRVSSGWAWTASSNRGDTPPPVARRLRPHTTTTRKGDAMVPNDPEAEKGVRTLLDRYAEAVYRADVGSLRSIFHPAAVMNGYLGDKLLVGTPEPFYADIGGHPPMSASDAPFKTEWTAVHVAGRTATATLEETGFFGAGHFVNYFHLLLQDGEWRIVSKTFESLP
jgi:Putative lumazine-binding